jgi:hypothetical protein
MSRPSRVVVRSGKRALIRMDGVADEQDFSENLLFFEIYFVVVIEPLIL